MNKIEDVDFYDLSGIDSVWLSKEDKIEVLKTLNIIYE